MFEVFVLLRTSLESFYKLVCVSFHGGGCEGWHKRRILVRVVLNATNELCPCTVQPGRSGTRVVPIWVD